MKKEDKGLRGSLPKLTYDIISCGATAKMFVIHALILSEQVVF